MLEKGKPAKEGWSPDVSVAIRFFNFNHQVYAGSMDMIAMSQYPHVAETLSSSSPLPRHVL